MQQVKVNSNTKRIALYGGAFDPVHTAHVEVAKSALRQARLDSVVFIPAAQSPLKEHSPIASDADRLDMLRLATKNEHRFAVDDCELRRGGVSYSVETVEAFAQREPEAELYWVIGADQLEQLDHWYRIHTLVQMVTFLVLARPGYEISAPNVAGLAWRRINAPLMEASSTLIRGKITKGQSIGGLVSNSVEAFIHEKGLYVSVT